MLFRSEGEKWELGFAFLRSWEMGFCALGLGFVKKNNRKMGMGFRFEQHRPGLWDLSWDLKKKPISWEIGLGPPLLDPLKRRIATPAHCWYGQRTRLFTSAM